MITPLMSQGGVSFCSHIDRLLPILPTALDAQYSSTHERTHACMHTHTNDASDSAPPGNVPADNLSAHIFRANHVSSERNKRARGREKRRKKPGPLAVEPKPFPGIFYFYT